MHREAHAEVRAGKGSQDSEEHSVRLRRPFPVLRPCAVPGGSALCEKGAGRDGSHLDQHRSVSEAEERERARSPLPSGFQSGQLGQAHGAQQRRGRDGFPVHSGAEGAGGNVSGPLQLGPGVHEAQRRPSRGLFRGGGQHGGCPHPGRVYFIDQKGSKSIRNGVPNLFLFSEYRDAG